MSQVLEAICVLQLFGDVPRSTVVEVIVCGSAVAPGTHSLRAVDLIVEAVPGNAFAAHSGADCRVRAPGTHSLRTVELTFPFRCFFTRAIFGITLVISCFHF